MTFSWLRAFERGARPFTAVALVLALFAPLLEGYLVLAASLSPAAMSCCKRNRTCSCCHRPVHYDSSRGPQLTAPSCCAPGCGQFEGTSGFAGLSVAESGFCAVPPLGQFPLLLHGRQAWSRRGLESALFQRPPPSLA